MSNDRVEVIRAFMIETPATAPIFARSVDAHLDSRVENIYREKSDDGRMNSESLIAGIANSVLGFTTAPERRVQMPGSYDQSRFRVVIEYRETSMGRTEKISYIVGYTDHDETTRTGDRIQFSRRMRVFFNNVSSVTRQLGDRTGAQKYRVNNRSQILTTPGVDEDDIMDERIARQRRSDRGSRYKPVDGHLLIPSIVIGRMSTEHIPELVGMPNIRREDIEDQRSSLRTIGARRTNSMNAVPAHYLSKVLAGHSDVRRGNQRTDNDGKHSPIKRIADLQREVEDDTLSNSAFFHTLVVKTNYVDDGFVEWGELTDLFPELDDDRVCQASPLAKRYRDRPGVNQVEHWDSLDTETIIANTLVSTITPMLTELLFDEIDFTITNDTRDGNVSVVLHDYMSMFDSMELSEHRDTLEYRIKRWVLDGQPWLQCTINITGTLSTMYECALVVEYDGGRPTPYRFATYADALSSSLVSIDDSKIDAISDSLTSLMKIIDEKYEVKNDSQLMLPRERDNDRDDRSRSERDGRGRDRGIELVLPDLLDSDRDRTRGRSSSRRNTELPPI